MNDLSKALLGMAILPLPLLGSLAALPDVEAPSQGTWVVAGIVAAAGALGAWFLEWTERKVVANRVVIDLKPNQVIVDGVPIDCPFSSMTHFFRSRDALVEAVGIAVNEAMLGTTTAFDLVGCAPRTNALVRQSLGARSTPYTSSRTRQLAPQKSPASAGLFHSSNLTSPAPTSTCLWYWPPLRFLRNAAAHTRR